MQPEIRTYTGRLFNFVDPTNNVIDIIDIAHGLSNICRFAGHVYTNLTVAQHSVWCSYNVKDQNCALAALMHDAHEAYVGDCPTPLKMLLPDYKVVEDRVQGWVLDHFGLPKKLPPCVKEVDQLAYIHERDSFMISFDEEQILGVLPNAWGHRESYYKFLDRYEELVGGIIAK
jgi:hypothetical protein